MSDNPSNNQQQHQTPTAPSHKVVWERDTLERLAFATLAEQRASRRWRIFFRFAWLALFAVLAWTGFHRAGVGSSGPSQPHTAVVAIKGEIAEGADASAEWTVNALRAAFEDEGSQAVVLLINSPGGSPVQAGIINDEVRRLKAKHEKPVYAVVEESCASAAYYIAVAADEIYVDKASIVGSIGVLMDGFGFTGLMDKLGVERRLMTAGENKGFLDPFSPMEAKQKEYAKTMLNEIHQQFIAVVKEGRGKRLKRKLLEPFPVAPVRAGPNPPEVQPYQRYLADGGIYTAEKALEHGLVDSLGTLDDAVAEARKLADLDEHCKVVEYDRPRAPAIRASGPVPSIASHPSSPPDSSIID